MKKIVELKIEKEAILSNSDMSSKGKEQVGNGTQYFGPQGVIPNYVFTFIDDILIGMFDSLTGKYAQDSYNVHCYGVPSTSSDSEASIRITSE